MMIAILSDFGNSEYLGVMKGVIYSINRDAKIVDLCNNIGPQNIKEGAWVLLNSYRYFPRNTIFLCVVDPRVGSDRHGIIIRTRNYLFVGPDNGLMWPAANKDKILDVLQINEKMTFLKKKPSFHSHNISKTFHGRDIFAKAAAQTDLGANTDALGTKTEIRNKLSFYLKDRAGEIVRIDSFGNIITNLQSLNKRKCTIKYRNKQTSIQFYNTYAEADKNVVFLIEGSSNTLEISVKNGNAARKLGLKAGDKIKIW